jgi:hypothetical protein
MDSNKRLMNCIYPNGLPNELKNCGNCLCCMNKQFNPFCYEQDKCVELNSNACIEYEKE